MATDNTGEGQPAKESVAQGQLERAIEELRQLLNDSPSDAAGYKAIGDPYLTYKHATQATDAYMQAASLFACDGDTRNAIALYKRILKSLSFPGRITVLTWSRARC